MGIVEDLEGAIDIVDLVGKYVSLKKAGVNYKAVCPFPGHSEKTPSFMVSKAKQLGYCFGCHKGGGPLKFVMDIENCEFKEALEILGNFTGIKVNSNFDKEKFEEKKNLYSLYKSAVQFYKKSLENYPEVKKYLMDRGLNNEIIDKFNFGYSHSGVELYNYLKEKGFDDKLIEESTIFVNVSMRKDKFINRIVFPIQNLRGDFVAFTARIIGQGEPKYLNSPASNIYDKSSILYGLFTAKNAITKNNCVIITEGQMDTIALQAAGFFNTVAVSGTALTEKHLTILKRLTKKIYICYDGDKAGEKATKLSLELMKNKGFEVKIISLPNGKDPDDIIKSGKDFNEYIDSAMTPIGYYIEKSKFDKNSIEDKKNLLQELIMIIKSYSDNIESDFYLKEVAKLLDINSKIIYDSFNRIRFSIKKNEQQKDKNSIISTEDLAIGYILNDKKNIKFISENIYFPNNISKNLNNFLQKGDNYLKELELSKKERYRGISLKIEEENKEKTPENINAELIKISIQINKEIYRKLCKELKIKMGEGDIKAFSKYSKLVQEAKKMGIK